jgi:hypothetical protein
MKKLKIYCETEYLDRFILEHSKLNQWSDAEQRLKYDQFVSLLGSKVDLILNKAKDEFIRLVQNNSFYQYLANNEHQNTLKIICNPNFFQDLKGLNLEGNELLLLNNDIHSCKAIEQELNVLVLSSQNIIKEIPHLFISESKTIIYRKTLRIEFYNWLKKCVKAPNSWFIVNDPYLIKDKYFHKSFPDLVKSFVKDLNKLQGLVLTSVDSKNSPDLNIAFLELKAVLTIFLSKIPFVSICRGRTHNRKFFTNYYFGDVGHSFCLLPEKNAHRGDKFSIYSIFNPKKEPNGITGYEIYQNEFEEIYKEYNTFKKQNSSSKYAVFKSINDSNEIKILK